MNKPIILIAAFLMSGTVSAGNFPAFPFIHATGEATINLHANMAEIEFELTEFTPDPQLTLDTIVADSNEVFSFLESQQIATNDIEAAEIRRFVSQSEYTETSESAKKYRLMRNFHVVVRDMQQWNAIVKGLLQKTYLGNFSVSFGRSDLQQVQQDLVKRAAEDAKQNAQSLARSFSVRLGNASAISQSPLKSISGLLGLDGAVVNESVQVQVKPTTKDFSVPAFLKYKQSLGVVYKIKP